MNPIFNLYNRKRFRGMTVKEACHLEDDEKVLYIIAKIDDALVAYQKERFRGELVGQN